MKKFIIMLVAALMAVAPASAGDPVEKQIKSNVKAKLKELKKGKWEIFATGLPLEAAVDRYYRTIAKMGEYAPGKEYAMQIIGIGSPSSNKTILRAKALTDAQGQYVQMVHSAVDLAIKRELGNVNASISSEEIEDFSQTLTASASTKLKGELTEYFCVIRESKAQPGHYEMNAYYLVDERVARTVMQETLKGMVLHGKIIGEYKDAVGRALNQEWK